MTTKSVGEEGFRWFIGRVEDRNDPEKIGRIRVRAFNVHGDDTEAPTSTLPWATVLLPVASASLKGVGISPTGIQVGSTVFGFFMDGNETTMPVIVGVIPGVGDLSLFAIERNALNREPLGPEPPSAYRAKYPYNKVVQTESGHLFEVDDTPDNERIHTSHRSGTYQEVNFEGNRVNRIVGNDYEIVQKNQKIYIVGDVDIEVKGNYKLNVTGNVTINGKTVNINNGSMGAARIGDSVPDTEVDGPQGIGEGSSTVFIGD